jgi:hypothetical protein
MFRLAVVAVVSQAGKVRVRVDHVMESRDVMNIHVVEHSILNGIEYCTFWFRSVVENDSTPATITVRRLNSYP